MLRSLAVVATATASALGAAVAMGGPHAVAAFTAAPAADARIEKARDGHFWAQAQVNGRPLRVLVDTGASEVALTRADARRLGVDVGGLDYDSPVTTADGRMRAARVRLARVAVGDAEVRDVDALVVRHGLNASLLGMSYLGRLSGFAADREAMTLRR
jgi:aspartyl protease family protein